jgi:L-fuconolactonase
MIEPRRTTRFGRIHAPDAAWLAKAPQELILDPDLPIIDTHHHLWDRSDHRYLLHEFLADLRSGHDVLATVFLQCHTMYRAGGVEEMRPVGETEFVAGIAAMSDSGGYGATRVAAGIVGFADLTLGDRVEAVLEAYQSRRRPVPWRSPLRQLGRRSDHRQWRACA